MSLQILLVHQFGLLLVGARVSPSVLRRKLLIATLFLILALVSLGHRCIASALVVSTSRVTKLRIFQTIPVVAVAVAAAAAVGMPRGIKKENLPQKVCSVCLRPFTWRKKWEKCWEEVSCCSKSCNHKRRQRFANNLTTPSETTSLLTKVDAVGVGAAQSSIVGQECSDGEIHQREEGIYTSFHSCEENESEEGRVSRSSTDEDQALVELQNDGDGDDDDGFKSEKDKRKAEKKAKKAERRAKREGRGDDSVGQKSCDVCGKGVDLLIRCTVDASQDWKMVCGKCWKTVSGGVVDGDTDHPYYRYGGLWKNRAKR